MYKAVYFCTLKGFWDILKQYRNRWHLIAVTFQSLAVFSGHTKMINDNIFLGHIDSALFSHYICLSNWDWLLSVRMCFSSRGIFIMYTQIAISSTDMLFSLKSCFLGPCRKALEWEIQWIIYWSGWVRYVAVVYFKTVKTSVQWIAAAWCDFLLTMAFQSLRTKTESVHWSGFWSVFLFADMAWASCVLKAWTMLLFCLACYRQAFSSACGFQNSTQLRKNC